MGLSRSRHSQIQQAPDIVILFKNTLYITELHTLVKDLYAHLVIFGEIEYAILLFWCHNCRK